MTEPLSCYQCGKNLLAWAASDMFCNQDCQRLWHEKNPLAGFGFSVADIAAAAEDVRAAFRAFGTPVPMERAPVLEVVCDAPTPAAPGPGYLLHVLRRLFG